MSPVEAFEARLIDAILVAVLVLIPLLAGALVALRCRHRNTVRETITLNGRRVRGLRCSSCWCWSPLFPEQLTLEERRRPTWPVSSTEVRMSEPAPAPQTSEDVLRTIDSQIEQRVAEEPILEWFRHTHLPAGPVRQTSEGFAVAALQIVLTHERNAERTVALRKLLEGKDAAVRSMIYTMRVRHEKGR